ncbi:C40 family peptidase [Arenibaculum sp.]|uniref:C40 family peptidase n=1 Tax=Arenibaculum sp. TaxID=2865862 RepID=UPI002E0D5978|nr:NlpC/P60 family protein [Arenibaculum sp.]
MNAPPDPRVTPYRPDLAAASLRGVVEAGRFVEGAPRQARLGRAPIVGEPDPAARRVSELLFGEVFTVYDERPGWAWGQCAADGYVGWVPAQALSDRVHAPTHRLKALRSFVFPEPDLKTPPLDTLSLGTPLAVAGERSGWCGLAGGGWVFARHVEPVGADPHDPVETALAFLGTPYLWGGRSSIGIDCSGLVQAAFAMANLQVPRDSDMQRAAIGTLASPDGRDFAFRRGDVVGFPGHVGLMLDAERLVHATGFHLAVCIEPVAAVAERAGGILAVRRV